MRHGRWRLGAVAAALSLVCIRWGGGPGGRVEDLTDAPQPQPATPASQDLAEPGASLDATAKLAARPAAPAGATAAEQPVDLTPPELGPLTLTIYNDGRALVRQQSTIDLKNGANTWSLAPVATTLDPSTVQLRTIEPGPGFRVVEQTALAGATDSQALMRRAIGQQVRVRDGRYSLAGELLAVEPEGVVIASEHEVYVHPAGELILPMAGEAPSLQPDVAWQLDADQAGQAKVEASYVAAGLTWAADYAVVLGDSDRQLSLEGWVRVSNACGADFEQAGLIFADGPSGLGDGERAVQAAVPGRYWLPRPADLPQGSAKRLLLLHVPAVRSAVRYEVTLAPTAISGVRLAAELVNDAANGLGQPLPPGPARLYAPDRIGRLQLLGEQPLPAIKLGAKVAFDLGPADDLQAEVKSVAIADGVVERTVTLTNLRVEDVVAKVIEQRPGSWQVIQASTGFTPPVAGRAAAEVTVPANGRATLVYRVKVAAGAPAEGSPA